MRARRPLLFAVLAILGGYAAYPYVTLYRLHAAVQHGDTVTLGTLVHWPKVRDGIKEDICDFLFEPPMSSSSVPSSNVPASQGTAVASGGLPRFGESFVRGIASNVVDRRVTPEGLSESFGSLMAKADTASRTPDVRLSWAFFESPTEFRVSLRAAGRDEHIRVQLELRGANWRVTRVWLPIEMLRQTNAETEVHAPAPTEPRNTLSVAVVAPTLVNVQAFTMDDARD